MPAFRFLVATVTVLLAPLACSDVASPPPIVVLSVRSADVIASDPPHIRVTYTITNYLRTGVSFATCDAQPSAGFDYLQGANWSSYAFVCGSTVNSQPQTLPDQGSLVAVLKIPGTSPGTYRVTLLYWTSTGPSLTTVTSPSFEVL